MALIRSDRAARPDMRGCSLARQSTGAARSAVVRRYADCDCAVRMSLFAPLGVAQGLSRFREQGGAGRGRRTVPESGSVPEITRPGPGLLSQSRRGARGRPRRIRAGRIPHHGRGGPERDRPARALRFRQDRECRNHSRAQWRVRTLPSRWGLLSERPGTIGSTRPQPCPVPGGDASNHGSFFSKSAALRTFR